jgi:hypothetical protein
MFRRHPHASGETLSQQHCNALPVAGEHRGWQRRQHDGPELVLQRIVPKEWLDASKFEEAGAAHDDDDVESGRVHNEQMVFKE